MAAPPPSANTTQIILSLPNPFTPMAFLPPDLAWQVTVSSYCIVGSLAVMIWEILSTLHQDYTLFTMYRLNLSMVIYCISRIFTLAYMVALAVVITAPIGDCSWFLRIQPLFIIAIASTALLFFVRVSALYYNNKFVMAFFFVSWLGVLGGSTLPATSAHGIRLGISNFCIVQKLPGYAAFVAILPLINDTLVFLATSYALLRNSSVDGVQNGVKVLFFGKHLPALPKTILHDGQIYYLTTVGLSIATSIVMCVPGIPAAYSSWIGTPNVVVTNCLACHVYRKIRFGIFRETAANPTITRSFASTQTHGATHNTQPSTTLSFNGHRRSGTISSHTKSNFGMNRSSRWTPKENVADSLL